MFGKLRPYQEYRASGQKWIGEVPASWSVHRLGKLARLITEKGRPELPLLSVFLNRGVIPYGQGGGQVHKPSLDLANYQVVHPGNLVLNNQQAWRGSVGVSRHRGIISPAYVVMALPADSNAEFCDLLFQSTPMIAQYVIASKGVGDIQRDIHNPWLKNVAVAFPPPEEQVVIARFLGAVDRRVNRFVRAKRRLIELLTEQKKAIITHAVIRGLNPNAKLKPSGMPWLGDMPEHWDLVPNRALLKLRKRLVGSKSDEYLLLSLTKRGIIARDMENPEGKFPTSFETYQAVEPGDFIFCLFDIDETPRAVGISNLSGMITGAYTRFACARPEYAEFIYRYYLALDMGKRLKPLYTGLRKVITKGAFLSAKMPLPPLEEARAIIAHLSTQSSVLDAMVLRAEREIDLIREYRTRLVADVVTGKLDVRAAAARLPEDEGELSAEVGAGEADARDEVAEFEDDAEVGAETAEIAD